MNLPLLSHGQSAGNKARLRFSRIPVLGDLSFSTKLILLVAVPLAMTLAVTLPQTVTGLNRLASVIAEERLAEEVTIIDQQFRHFEAVLNDAADSIAADPNLLNAVRGSNNSIIASSLLAKGTQLGLQFLQVVDAKGKVLGQEHTYAGNLNHSEILNQPRLGLAELEVVRIVHLPAG